MRTRVIAAAGTLLAAITLSACSTGTVSPNELAGAIDPNIKPVSTPHSKTITTDAYCDGMLNAYREYGAAQASFTQAVSDASDKQQALHAFTAQQRAMGKIDQATAPYKVTDDPGLDEANQNLTGASETLLNTFLEAKRTKDTSKIDPAIEEWNKYASPIAQGCFQLEASDGGE